ncbi:hypothetical protein DSL92_08215 [Billgrantia gudaonensis]|uniref:Uncharacterized protein n=1 Tax=Billgrantia gudaonensis TaxID=376427 RepID=A0A432JGW2_9GAMM|nr:hypothetical protein DSL92_08215 [Halomonas gudaonensis]
MLPLPRNVYQGYRILQEYHCFPGPSSSSTCSMEQLPARAPGGSRCATFSRTLPADALGR